MLQDTNVPRSFFGQFLGNLLYVSDLFLGGNLGNERNLGDIRFIICFLCMGPIPQIQGYSIIPFSLVLV